MPLIRKPANRAPPVDAPPVESSSVDVLTTLTSGTPDERWAAARAAIEVNGAAEALGRALHSESDPRVREAMFTSLARIATPQSVDAIVPLLRVDDASLRTGAIDALRAMVGAVRERLPTLLNDADSDVRLLSCEIARGLPGTEATQMLCGLLAREQEINVCAAAIEVLAEVGTAEALPVLADCQRRFHTELFLAFAIKVATDRILSQSATSHG